jgi:PadR family transcriptional regulator
MRRLSLHGYLVLRFLQGGGEAYGLEIATGIGAPSGTVYPLLENLERKGLVASRWEDIDEKAAGRRRRHYYWVTDQGRLAAAELPPLLRSLTADLHR